MEASGEKYIQPTFVGRVRERVWQSISKDAISQDVMKQWTTITHTMADSMNARKLAHVRAYMTTNAEHIGQQMAIGSRILDVVTGSLLGAVGVLDGTRAFGGKNALTRTQGKRVFFGGLAKGFGGILIVGMRPLEYAMIGAAKKGKPLAEKVSTIVDSIALKGETHDTHAQVFVGSAKA